MFPGDAEFSLGRYGELNWAYVVHAVRHGAKAHQRALYELELPTAQQSALIANQNRDPKKQKRPFNMDDFSLFKPLEDRNLASAQYASAAVKMIKNGQLPPWALFCYKEMAAQADPAYDPGVCSYKCDDAMLLHPERRHDGWFGMLVAQESASGQVREMTNEHGATIKVQIPPVRTKIVAEEDVTLPLA